MPFLISSSSFTKNQIKITHFVCLVDIIFFPFRQLVLSKIKEFSFANECAFGFVHGKNALTKRAKGRENKTTTTRRAKKKRRNETKMSNDGKTETKKSKINRKQKNDDDEKKKWREQQRTRCATEIDEAMYLLISPKINYLSTIG